MVSKHLRIHGQVQGVGFRWSLAREAQRLGVTGWVRNRRDGSVEALISGSESEIDLLVAWAHRGPAPAQVVQVEVRDAQGEFETFEQWPTL
jgi:acylphosphatase